MRYIIRKLGFLIILFALAAFSAVFGPVPGAAGVFLDAYLRFALYVIVMGLVMHFIGDAFPRRFSVERGLFRSAAFEDGGSLYERLFRVSSWKDRRFDASEVFSGTRGKNVGITRDPSAVHAAVQETCAAELTHWVLIFLSPLLLPLIKSGWRWPLWALYVLFNLSDIVIQRYNRPRMLRIADKICARREAAA